MSPPDEPAGPPVMPINAACAETFHRRTCMVAQADDRLPVAPALPHEPGTVLRLPQVAPMPGPSLEQVIAWRRTRREFDAQAGLSLPQLARLLVLSCGRTAPCAPGAWAPDAGHRAVPSAGATYPVDAQVIVQRVEGLAPGVYGYDSLGHALVLRRAGRFEAELQRWTLDQPWMLAAAAIFVLVGRLDRIAARYGSRGYRYMLMEAGHIAQNLYLLGAAHGLCVQAAGGFVDAAIDRLLALPDQEHALYLLALGPGTPGASPWQAGLI